MDDMIATQVPGYFVTESGEVFSVKSGSPKRMVPFICSDGYEHVTLHLGRRGLMKRCSVHALVALAFVGPRPGPEYQVRHLDGNRRNNVPSNLAWGTVQDNADDKRRHGNNTANERNPNAKLTMIDAEKVRARYASGESQQAIADSMCIGQSQVSRIVLGVHWKRAGNVNTAGPAA